MKPNTDNNEFDYIQDTEDKKSRTERQEELSMQNNPQNSNPQEEAGRKNKRLDKYLEKRNRRVKRNWIATVISLALVVAIGWNCVFDNASWFRWISAVDAYESGPVLEQQDIWQPVISEQDTSAGNGPEVTYDFQSQADQNQGGNVDSGSGSVDQPQIDQQGGSDSSSYVEEQNFTPVQSAIINNGSAYLQVLYPDTPVYTSTSLNEWFGTIDIGIVYGTYYYSYPQGTDVVEVTFNTDYGLVFGYVKAADTDLLDTQATVRLLTEVQMTDAYFDLERTVPLAWVSYRPKDAAPSDQINVNQPTEEIVYNPESIIGSDTQDTNEIVFNPESIVQGNESMDANSILDGAIESTVDNNTIEETATSEQGTTVEPTTEEVMNPENIVQQPTEEPTSENKQLPNADDILQGLVSGFHNPAEPTVEPTEAATEEPQPEVVGDSTPTNEPTVEPTLEQSVEPTAGITGETDILNTETTITFDEATDEPTQQAATLKLDNANDILLNLVSGFHNQSTGEPTSEVTTPEATPTEAEGGESDTTEPTETEPTETEPTGTEPTVGEPTEEEPSATDPTGTEPTETEPTEVGTTDDSADTTEPTPTEDVVPTDDATITDEIPAPIFVALSPLEVPAYYNLTADGVYAFEDANGQTQYRVYGLVNDVQEGFFASDANGNLLEPVQSIDLAEEANAVAPDETEEPNPTSEEPSVEPTKEAPVFEVAEAAFEAIPLFYELFDGGIYAFMDVDGQLHHRVYGTVDGEQMGFYASDAAGVPAQPLTLVDVAADAVLAGVQDPTQVNTETTETTEPTGETAEPTVDQTEEPTETTEPTDPTNPTDTGVTDPTDATTPTEGTQPTGTTEPTDVTEPTDATEPTDVTEQIGRAHV